MTSNMPKPFRTAKRQRDRSIHHSTKVGCVIVKGGNIIAVGHNAYGMPQIMRTHKYAYSTHAEMQAILSVWDSRKLKGSTMYIYREVRNLPADAKPCKDCLRIIKKYGISKIRYSSHKTIFEEEKL